MTTEKRKKHMGNPISGAICVSIVLHSCILAGLVYAANSISVPKLIEQDAPMNVMMIDIAAFAAPSTEQSDQPNVQTDVAESLPNEEIETPIEPEPEPEPEVIPEPEITPEPEIIPEPEAIPLKQLKPEEIKPKEKKPDPIKKPKPKPKRQQELPKVAKKQMGNQPISGDAAVTSAPVANKGVSLDTGAKAINKAKPLYPPRARAMGIEGKIIVKYDIDADGRVINIQIVSESPKNMFNSEVKRAMKRWRFEANKPTYNQKVTISFKLNNGAVIT